MAAEFPLVPAPRFGTSKSGDREENSPYVARIIVGSEELAAVLDGLSIEATDSQIRLALIALAEGSGPIHADAVDLDHDADLPFVKTVASEVGVLAGRLPLAAMVLEDLAVLRDTAGPGFDSAAGEGRDTAMRELLVGSIGGFEISGAERDVLVKAALSILPRLKKKKWKREVKAILADTGREKKTGEPCTLSGLPMPRLAEWWRPLMEEISGEGFRHFHAAKSKKAEKKARQQHEILRQAWFRFGREVRRGVTQ